MTRAVVAIVGPTGSGKSTLAVEVARALDGEILSCDALQVYRGLDIGTAKPSIAERREVTHHLLDVAAPDQEFSAAQYVSLAAPVVSDIVERGRLPVIVGGTGLYLRALRSGLFEGPGRSAPIRERLSRIADRRGPGALHRILKRWDPVSAARIHPNDRVRLVRGIEVFLASGRRMSELMQDRKSPLEGFRVILVGLRPSRERLQERIANRVDAMYSRGLVGEVRRLQADYGAGIPAFKAIGYREALLFLAGEIDTSRAKELTVRATIQYAKRQMTWFRREPGVVWFDGSGDDAEIQRAVAEYARRSLQETGERNTPRKEVSC